MPTHWGNEGQIKVGANVVAEVTEFEFTESVSPVSDTSMGDSYETHIAGSGIKKWQGSLTCHWDETNATGQGALTVGASVVLSLNPEGSATGDTIFGGTATITQRGQSTKMDGDTIKVSFEFVGSGALTQSVAP